LYYNIVDTIKENWK